MRAVWLMLMGCAPAPGDRDDTAQAPEDTAVEADPTVDRPPTCRVEAPTDGATVDGGAPVAFAALLADDRTPAADLTYTWRIDDGATFLSGSPGPDGRVSQTVSALPVGAHGLTLTARDAAGGEATCAHRLTVRDCADGDGDGVGPCDGDCDDADPTIAPHLPELPDGLDNDCDGAVDEGTAAVDDDGDGWSEEGGDCDDADPSVHPEAVEVYYDGVDQDCDGASDFDADGDGADSDAWGGADCDDADPAVSPLLPEARDGRDTDCDGYCDEGLLSPGDLVITEIHKQPAAASESFGEWFEVANVTATDITLCLGWTGTDDLFDAFTVVGPVVIPAGAAAAFVRDGDAARNGGITPDYTFGRSFQLGNDSDQVVLSFDDPALGAFEMDRVDYEDGPLWPDTAGASLSLDPAHWSADDNDDAANWCAGQSAFGAGDLGTPGAANDPC